MNKVGQRETYVEHDETTWNIREIAGSINSAANLKGSGSRLAICILY